MGDLMDAQPAIELLAGKWTLPMLAALEDGGLRHNEWIRALDSGVTQKVFTATRHRLEDAGLVRKEACPDGSPGVCYEMTPLARSLTQPLAAMARWAHEHQDALAHWADWNERHPC